MYCVISIYVYETGLYNVHSGNVVLCSEIHILYVHTVQYSIQYSGGIVAVMIYLTTELGTRHRCRDNVTT